MAVGSGSKAVQGGSSSSSAGNAANGAVVVDVDSDEGDKEVISREQVKNLIWIDQSGRHKKALEFWRRQDSLCTRRVDSKRKQSLAVKNEVYQLIGFYSVFQGVMLTAVSQSNLLHCNNQWSAISLSGLASFVVVIGIIQKFWAVWELERTILNEKASRKIYVNRGERLINKGENFRFHLHAQDGTEKLKSSRWKLSGSICGVIVVLLLFSGTFIASIHQILCHPGA